MKRIPFLAIAILVAGSLSGLSSTPAAAARAPITERSDAVAPAAGLKRLIIENGRGTTRVRASADGQLHITAIKSIRAFDAARAERYRRETGVTAQREGDQYAVRVTYPRNIEVKVDLWDLFRSHDGDSDLVPKIEVEVIVDAPPALAVEVHTASGDQFVQDRDGALDLHASSGDVTVRHCKGPIVISASSGDVLLAQTGGASVRTASGDLDAQDVGVLDAQATSGDMTVNGARDSLRLRTASGDISVQGAPKGVTVEATSGTVVVRDASGRVSGSTASGDLSVGLRAPVRAVDLDASSGDVELAMNDQPDAAFDLAASSGEIEYNGALQQTRRGDHSLLGQIGRGTVPVRIRTASGRIIVKSRGK